MFAQKAANIDMGNGFRGKKYFFSICLSEHDTLKNVCMFYEFPYINFGCSNVKAFGYPVMKRFNGTSLSKGGNCVSGEKKPILKTRR